MPKRVLIAEDYDDVRSMMKLFLEHQGCEVLEASDGFEAVEKAVSARPDLILMDLAMPVMDGIQATQAIRKHLELDDVPIIAVTGYADFYNERARDVGCNEVIQKPVDFGRLDPVIRRYVTPGKSSVGH
jgi:two-component system cell cycle response regulator DivK